MYILRSTDYTEQVDIVSKDKKSRLDSALLFSNVLSAKLKTRFYKATPREYRLIQITLYYLSS